MSSLAAEQFWDNVWSNHQRELYPFEIEKFAKVLNIVPPDVHSVVDVGCGSGHFTNRMAGKYDVLAVDISSEALARVQCPGKLGSIDEIPADDRQFDLAISMEVLEHLPYDGTLERGASELARVADKYVLVTTPAHDDPFYPAVRCPHCGGQFHVSQHVRFFEEDDFPELIPGFRLIQLHQTGRRIRGSARLRKLALAGSHYTGSAYAGIRCLICRSEIPRVSARESLWSGICVGLDRVLCRIKETLRMTTSHNFVALYQRAA